MLARNALKLEALPKKRLVQPQGVHRVGQHDARLERLDRAGHDHQAEHEHQAMCCDEWASGGLQRQVWQQRLGRPSIWTSGGHIVQGTAKMNDTYSMDTYTKQQVMRQEVGHTFGLGHTSTDGSSQDTCMDYATAKIDRDQWPNLHDYQQLESIYKAHTDSSDAFSSRSAASKLPAAARAIDPGDPSQRSRLIDRSPNGRVEIYERDLGQGNKVITRLIRVDESTPAPEGSGPGKSAHDGHTHDDGEAH